MIAQDVVNRAARVNTVIPAFNIPYLPMMSAVVRAIIDEDTVAMIQVARLEWLKYKARSLESVAEEYFKCCDTNHTLLHLDHVPVIDEDNLLVDVPPIVEQAIKVGYQSVMIDASRLPLEENISLTRYISDIAHDANVPVEAKLVAAIGAGSPGSRTGNDELLSTSRGVTDIAEAKLFTSESKCDWLSVEVGGAHGAKVDSLTKRKKPRIRLDIDHIALLRKAIGGVPMSLHDGFGIDQAHIRGAVKNGIAKISISTEIRKQYEFALEERPDDVAYAQEKVHERTRWVIREFLQTTGNRSELFSN